MPKSYAAETTIPIGKSKVDIDKLLREWGCDRIMWEEDLRTGAITLRFVWTSSGNRYAAKLMVRIAGEDVIRRRDSVLDKRTGRVNENKLRHELERAGRSEMRILLLWLKAAFNAVEAGLMKAEELFLPFFVTKDDVTVAETIIPNLPALMSGGALKLLAP